MEPRFKKGDKVLIRKDLIEGKKYNHTLYYEFMYKEGPQVINKVITYSDSSIYRNCVDYYLDNFTWLYSEEMFEPYQPLEKPVPKFNYGDRVYFGYTKTIRRVVNKMFNRDGYTWQYKLDDDDKFWIDEFLLTKVPDSIIPPPLFKKGDKVICYRLYGEKVKINSAGEWNTYYHTYRYRVCAVDKYNTPIPGSVPEYNLIPYDSISFRCPKWLKNCKLFSLFKKQPPVVIDIKVNNNKRVLKLNFSN